MIAALRPWLPQTDAMSAGLLDTRLSAATLGLLAFGWVMMTSASMGFATDTFGNPMYHAVRHGIYLVLGLAAGAYIYRVPMNYWHEKSWLFLAVAVLLLIAVLVPGIGREVNGSRRWLPMGIMNLQSSEVAKVFMNIYLASYLVRRLHEVRQRLMGFIKPMAVLGVFTILLLAEPDFGAAVVMMGSAMGVLFLGGVRLVQFVGIIAVVLAAAVMTALSSAYRMKRLTAYTDPWADMYNTGYQLTQSLIAFGRGEWTGVGLGNSVQKLFYLPEAHTDFVIAILAEELGLVGMLAVIALFSFFVYRILCIAREAELKGQLFSAYVSYGIALLFGFQAFINIGVNCGLLPTKGLTMPFFSYGGSSLIMNCVLVAMVLRTARELRQSAAGAPAAPASAGFSVGGAV